MSGAPPVLAAAALESALRASGLPCGVEGRAALAIVATDAAHLARLADAGPRREVLALARAHGFTHVAVELADDLAPAGAAVLRD